MMVLVKTVGFFEMPLRSMSYRPSAHVIFTGIKTIPTYKYLGKNLAVLSYLKV